jgi:hypothetical protein
MLFEQEQHHGKVAEDLGVYWPSLRNKSSGVSNCEDKLWDFYVKAIAWSLVSTSLDFTNDCCCIKIDILAKRIPKLPNI